MSQVTTGRAEAAETIWHWQGPVAAETPESAGRARLRGVLQGLGGGAIAALLAIFWSATVAIVVGTIAAIVFTSALLSPEGIYATLERLFAALGRLTGQALSWLLLVPVFYLFFLPFGAVMRRGRRDRMARFFDRDAPTYWEPRSADARASRRRQY